MLYTIDNCFDVTYHAPMVSNIYSVLPKLQDLYFSTPKPDTGFSVHVYNIAVHIRRGDARDRLLDVNYYVSGIEYYRKQFSIIECWIFSDDPVWRGHQQIVSHFPEVKFHLPDYSDDLLLSFHRMVMADGLVMSESSVSTAAALISNCSKIATYDHSKYWDTARREL
jgi:hypothetical protein